MQITVTDCSPGILPVIAQTTSLSAGEETTLSFAIRSQILIGEGNQSCTGMIYA